MILLDNTFWSSICDFLTLAAIFIVLLVAFIFYVGGFARGHNDTECDDLYDYNAATGVSTPKPELYLAALLNSLEIERSGSDTDDEPNDEAHPDTQPGTGASSTDGEAHTYVYVDPSHPDKEC